VQAELAKTAMGMLDRRVAGASLGLFFARAHADVPIDKLEASLRSEVARLATDGPTDDELRRAKALLEVGWLERVSGLEGRADELSRHTLLFGDPTRVNRRLEPLAATTAADVAAAVGSFLVNEHPAVVTYEPAGEPEGAR
jgi:predicted Zn-dependent peptidase